MSDYTLDPNAAKDADKFNARIDEKGKYLGTFTRAEPITSKKGTKGVDLSFKADDGATADYLTIWTHNKNGEQLMGFNALMAIMTCLRVKTLDAEDGDIEKYDQTQNKRVTVNTPLFKELMGKTIGLVLFMEEYPKNAGGTGWKPVITSIFDKDEFTASEILKKSTKPEILEKMVAMLRDKPLKGQAKAEPAKAAAKGSVDDFEDDIPF